MKRLIIIFCFILIGCSEITTKTYVVTYIDGTTEEITCSIKDSHHHLGIQNGCRLFCNDIKRCGIKKIEYKNDKARSN